jgi:5,10-methenyltetrahydrofolate synthetase
MNSKVSSTIKNNALKRKIRMTMQHDEITEKKRALRRTIAERRKQYPQEVLADLSAQITERILALEAYQKARTVFLYMELPGEVQMRALIEQCLRDRKKAAVPKVFRGSGRMHSPDGEASTPGMRFYEIRDFDHLVRGAMNILEPDPAVCACLDEEKDALMIMPGVAFDTKRHYSSETRTRSRQFFLLQYIHQISDKFPRKGKRQIRLSRM